MIGIPEVVLTGFDYLSATRQEEMRRNLALLYETAEGTCPGDRLFGLNPGFQDAPLNVAVNLFALEVIEKTEVYENKAEILDIRYTQSQDGNLTPQVIVGAKNTEGG
jgi:hypothetical protein